MKEDQKIAKNDHVVVNQLHLTFNYNVTERGGGNREKVPYFKKIFNKFSTH